MSAGIKKNQINKEVELGGSNDGSGNFSEMIYLIERDEIDSENLILPNEFVDDFGDESRGIKNNLEQGASHLQLITGQNSGTYDRSAETSIELKQSIGVAKLNLIALGVKNNSVTSTQFIVPGDVTDIIANSKRILIYKVITDDARPKHIHIFDSSGNLKPFLVTAAIYNSSQNETTITVSNPAPTYDLSLGLNPSEFDDKLRVSPFEHKIQVKSATASSFEDMEIKDVFGLGNVSIPGVPAGSSWTELGNFTGSIIKSDAVFSRNRQYGVVRAVEQASPSPIQHWFYSNNGGITWTKFTTMKTMGGTHSNDFTGAWWVLNRSQIAVSNDGKFFGVYFYRNGANIDSIGGVYADLTMSPTILTDTPATGADASNDNNVSGSIASNPSVAVYGSIAYDESDMSFIAVGIRGANNTLRVRWYSNGGATHLGLNSASLDHTAHEVQYTAVFGTGSSHRTFSVYRSFGNGALAYVYWDQGNLSPTGSGNLASTGDPNPIMDGYCDQVSGKVVIVYRHQVPGSQSIRYVSGSLVGTPIFSATKHFTATMLADLYNGWSSQQNENWWKTYGQRILIDPADANHLLFCIDYEGPDSYIRSTLLEILDDSNFIGIAGGNYIHGSLGNLRQDNGTSQNAQTFTASNTRIRSVAVKYNQAGNIPPGFTIECQIQETTGGAPNGVIVATSDTRDPSKFIKGGDGEWIWFNFNPGVTIVAGVHALVFVSNIPLDNLNNIAFYVNNSNPFAGGNYWHLNNGVWTSVGSMDLVFEINSEWVTNIGVTQHATISNSGYGLQDQESGLAFMAGAGNFIQFVTRAAHVPGGAWRPYTGHPYRRTITINPGAKSTISAASPYGHLFYDPNLVFTTALGTNECSSQNVSTGTFSTTEKGEDRSGWIHTATYSAVTYAAQPLLDSGQAGVFNGANSRIVYPNSTVFSFANKSFAIEIEVVQTQTAQSKGNNNFLFGNLRNGGGSNAGWGLLLDTSNRLRFALTDSSLLTLSSNTFPNLNSRMVFRVTGDGTTIRMFFDVGSGMTECTYTTQHSSPYNMPVPGENFEVGNFPIGQSSQDVSAWAGQIGYVKVVNGASTFQYDGFSNQGPLTQVQNCGTKAIAEFRVGDNSNVNGTNFDNVGVINLSQGGIVDSYPQYFMFKKKVNGATGKRIYLRVQLERNGARDISNMDNIYVRYSE
jgi:hypothetical protein